MSYFKIHQLNISKPSYHACLACSSFCVLYCSAVILIHYWHHKRNFRDATRNFLSQSGSCAEIERFSFYSRLLRKLQKLLKMAQESDWTRLTRNRNCRTRFPWEWSPLFLTLFVLSLLLRSDMMEYLVEILYSFCFFSVLPPKFFQVVIRILKFCKSVPYLCSIKPFGADVFVNILPIDCRSPPNFYELSMAALSYPSR